MPNSSQSFDELQHSRTKVSEAIQTAGRLNIHRFFAPDGRVYGPGALDAKTTELMELTGSMVLRCDDVALVLGGSIVIPHLRRAVARVRKLDAS